MTQLLDTVARFVEQGGTLVVEAKPEPPVGFDRLEYLLNPGADLVSASGPEGDVAEIAERGPRAHGSRSTRDPPARHSKRASACTS